MTIERLWAGWRNDYVSDPKTGRTDTACVMCNIVDATDDAEALVLERTELTVTVMRTLRPAVVMRAAIAAVGRITYLTTSPEIVQRIQSAIFRFNSQVFVEDNGAQSFLTQWATGEQGLPIRGFTTTAGKKFDEHFGIESLAVEMRNGGWIIPATASQEVDAWVNEMLFYSPDSHTGDRLMASWFSRECARSAGAPMFRALDTTSR